LMVEGLTCRGSANQLKYFLERDDMFELPGYVKLEAWPGPGSARARVSFDPSQCDEHDVKLAITEPYYDAELNRWTSPQLDDVVARIRVDGELKAGIHEMKMTFMTRMQTLLHGDLHSGSVMVTEDDTKVIDPEFAFYGPMSFDIGALLGNYLLAYMAQPGQATGDDDRVEYSRWILATVTATWNTFESEFRRLWTTERSGEFFPANTFDEGDQHLERALSTFIANVLEDSIGFAAAKMIRRVIGVSHVEDLLSIADADRRAECERHVLVLARAMLLGRKSLPGIDDVVRLACEIRARDPECR
jgi:5-methylthioribose kinase